jgi:HEAT repeat protein
MKLITAFCAFAIVFACSGAEPKPSPAHREKEATLIQVLQSNADRKAKADACRELAVVGGKAAVKPLLALLGDEQLSHMARYALETNPDPAVDRGLREAAATLQGKLLVGVIGSIGVRRDTKAVAILEKHLASAEPDVVQSAARSLGAIGNSAAAKALQKAWPKTAQDNKLAVAEGLFRCAEVSGSARSALAIYQPLRQSSIPQVRSGATGNAILRQGSGNLALLQESLRSQDEAVFSGALKASFALSGTQVTRALELALSQAPKDRLTSIIQALGNRQDPEALTTLSNLGKDRFSPLRLSAIDAIGQIGNTRSVPVLVQIMGDADAPAAQAAKAALAAIQGPEADKAVYDMLSAGNTQTRLTGLELVARRRMTSAMPELIKLTREGDPRLRAAATRQIGEMGGTAEVPTLLDVLLTSTDSEQLSAVEYALGLLNTKAPDKDALSSQIVKVLPRAQPAQKTTLLQVLGAAGGPVAYQAVSNTLKDGNQEVRGSAMRVLGNWNGQEAAPLLLEMAKTSANATEKTLALRGYLRLASQADVAASQRLQMCRNASELAQRPEEKRLLLAALGGTRSVEALADITPHLADESTRQEAATAALDIVEHQLRDQNVSKDRSALVPTLEKIVESGAKEDLIKRAKAALDKAKK